MPAQIERSLTEREAVAIAIIFFVLIGLWLIGSIDHRPGDMTCAEWRTDTGRGRIMLCERVIEKEGLPVGYGVRLLNDLCTLTERGTTSTARISDLTPALVAKYRAEQTPQGKASRRWRTVVE